MIPVLTLDGAGHGTDGTVWGGEILLSSLREYERVGSLEAIPLPGGDAAVKDPSRIVAAACRMHGVEYEGFEVPDESIFETALKQAPLSSGAGRFLDAVSCALDICCSRSYGGEPAIRLEAYLNAGFSEVWLDGMSEMEPVELRDDDLPRWMTSSIIAELVENRAGGSGFREKSVIAAGAVLPVFAAMAEHACEVARKEGSGAVGVTGGVAYNLAITSTIDRVIQDNGLRSIFHSFFPPGDGGISAGQAIVAGSLLNRT